MPSWWGKSSSKDANKEANKESFIDTIQRRFKISSEEKWNNRSKGSRRTTNISPKISQSRAESRSTSPSTQVSRCQSFAERPQAQPLPLPRVLVNSMQPNDVSRKRSSRPLSPLPRPKLGDVHNGPYNADVETDIAMGSVTSESSIDSDDPSDSRLLSPQASDYEYGNKTAINSPSSSVQDKDHFPITARKKSTHKSKPSNILSLNSQTVPASPKRGPLRSHVANLQIPPHGAFCSAPDSSRSSPSRSPIRPFYPDFWAGKSHTDIPFLSSGQCSSPGSGHNSVGGDMSSHLFWQHNNRCSPECSPIPSPRMTSPGPGSRIQSGAVTPLHPRAGLAVSESTGNWPDDGKQQSHRLPLPPLSITRTCPFSTSYSTGTTPSVPRSPGRPENPSSPGSRWKKGRLLGRGTFGQVYLGFNSESGEMCAMKEVTLFSDDAKSKESAQQLGQEIALLSRLQHPNIVQYYGSETVEDKLYIYLEYVSGGSIYKILQDYGQLGEVAIRSYTKQILSGLAYLHAKNTVHRDIKGANILVDPNGRVKLADFGMAKHISGYSCPLSFKGSPYWMAPEVIKNSSGCNLAVDIWSLGCTVLEMATTKPPWSQYEGVAAMFKIGNSKDLPAIPDHISDEGKDFIRLCLQRNPANRPSAAKLLDHPFVRNAAMLERPITSPDPPIEAISSLTNSVRSLGIGHQRNLLSLDSEGIAMHHSRGQRIGDGHMPRNISCPVSPIGSPLLQSRSPQHQSGRLSPSPISSPHTMSGSSTPLTGGPPGSIPLYNPKPPPTTKNTILYYHHLDSKPDVFRGMPQASPLFRDPSENRFLVNNNNNLGRSTQDPRELLYDGQSVLANRVSQQLLKDHLKLNPLLDLNPSSSSSVLGRNNVV